MDRYGPKPDINKIGGRRAGEELKRISLSFTFNLSNIMKIAHSFHIYTRVTGWKIKLKLHLITYPTPHSN